MVQFLSIMAGRTDKPGQHLDMDRNSAAHFLFDRTDELVTPPRHFLIHEEVTKFFGTGM
jgi:hypothetical protein